MSTFTLKIRPSVAFVWAVRVRIAGTLFDGARIVPC